MNPKQNRAFRMRNQSVEELEELLREHRKELFDLRVNQISSGNIPKLHKIKTIRKAVAKIMTVLNEKRRQELKDSFKTRKGIRAYNEANKTNYSLNKTPKELKARKTRALRKKISKKQQNKLLPKQQKKQQNFPQRVYALKA